MGSTSASTKAGKSSANVADGTKIDATLVNPLDVDHNKVGDRVEARITQDVKQNGKVTLKKGTRLIGHVTQTQSRADGKAQSQLGVAFDRAIPSKGRKCLLTPRFRRWPSRNPRSWLPQDPTTRCLLAARWAECQVAAQWRRLGRRRGDFRGTRRGERPEYIQPSVVGYSGNFELRRAVKRRGGGLTSTGQLNSKSRGVFGLQGLSIDSAASSARRVQ